MSDSPTQAAMEAAKEIGQNCIEPVGWNGWKLIEEDAATVIDRAIASATAAKDARIRVLEAALTPFADLGAALPSKFGDAGFIQPVGGPSLGHQPTVGDLRHATQALKATP